MKKKLKNIYINTNKTNGNNNLHYVEIVCETLDTTQRSIIFIYNTGGLIIPLETYYTATEIKMKWIKKGSPH